MFADWNTERCEVLHLEEDMNKDDKLKALDAAITQIEKSYGKGSIMKLGDSGTNMNIETVPTGSISLDIALGLGGVPKGRIIESYGQESSGKTTVARHMGAEVQIRYTQRISVWILTISTFRSRTTVSRLWKLPRPWFVPAQ